MFERTFLINRVKKRAVDPKSSLLRNEVGSHEMTHLKVDGDEGKYVDRPFGVMPLLFSLRDLVPVHILASRCSLCQHDSAFHLNTKVLPVNFCQKIWA